MQTDVSYFQLNKIYDYKNLLFNSSVKLGYTSLVNMTILYTQVENQTIKLLKLKMMHTRKIAYTFWRSYHSS